MAEEMGPGESEVEYVPVVYARDPDQAEVYKELLADHEIPAVLDDMTARGRRGLPVLVPEELLDEASQIIADFEQNEEFEQDDEEFEEEEEDEEEDLQPLGEEGFFEEDEEEEADEEEGDDEDEGFDDEEEDNREF